MNHASKDPALSSMSARNRYYACYRAGMIVFLCVVALPMLIYFGLFLAVYGNQLLSRRDEANIFMILRLIQSGAPIEQVFLGTLGKGFVLLGLIIHQVSGEHFVEVSRVASMFFGIMATLVTGLIARRLARSGWALVIAAALVMSSQVFVQESTYFRANLPSLLIGLLVLYGFVEGQQQSLAWVLVLGALYALSLQVKMLSLTMLPVCCLSMVHDDKRSTAKRLLSFAAGLTALIVLFGTVNLGNDYPLSLQLPLLVGTPVSVRLERLAKVTSNFFRHDPLPIYACVLGIGRSACRLGRDDCRGALHKLPHVGSSPGLRDSASGGSRCVVFCPC
ncbi:MAG TPA: phospholipid carrier-dependent glycosyltransferase [Anaerolineae bacterium]|nr:phospholipid carrier-dependent glycosyltransferase [Anaerolineae bacterium]